MKTSTIIALTIANLLAACSVNKPQIESEINNTETITQRVIACEKLSGDFVDDCYGQSGLSVLDAEVQAVYNSFEYCLIKSEIPQICFD